MVFFQYKGNEKYMFKNLWIDTYSHVSSTVLLTHNKAISADAKSRAAE